VRREKEMMVLKKWIDCQVKKEIFVKFQEASGRNRLIFDGVSFY